MDGGLITDAGSFRDPSGQVYAIDNRILRTVTDRAADDYGFVRDTGLLQRLADAGRVVAARELDRRPNGLDGNGIRHVLEHPRLPFISYPYEWPFAALKAAALFHLDLQIEALDSDIALADASAYNVQFLGAAPIFIDYLSFRRYRDGEFWLGHRQFCEQFLNPLLLRAMLGIPHNAWYRGSLEGIQATELDRLLSWRHKLSWNIISQVVLPARLQNAASGKTTGDLRRIGEKQLPRSAYRHLMAQLRHWIDRLEPADGSRTTWSDYTLTHTYASDEEATKRGFVADFAAAVKPGLLWDVGCNTGDYSALALEAGARRVIGFDFDQGALDAAFARASEKGLAFQPLFLDGANPSPDQGWAQGERGGLMQRASADALIALAFIHHLVIGRNVPLDAAVGWLTALAPRGVIEFVGKEDTTVRRMLALREDIFDDYTEDGFVHALERRARIVRAETVSAEGRRLFWFENAAGSR